MRLGLLTGLLALVAAQGTTHPDFSGTWTYVNAESTNLSTSPNMNAYAPSFGLEFTAKQDAAALTIDQTIGDKHYRATYRFDGSETTGAASGGMGQPDVQVVSTASWSGASLIIKSVTDYAINGTATKVERVKTMHLETDGTIVVQTESRTTPQPRVPITTSVYRRK